VYVFYGTALFYSGCLVVPNGVKQGGIISPIFFSIYYDEVLCRLQSAGVGCYIGQFFVGACACLYADDLTLLAPTASAVRRVLAICERLAYDFHVTFDVDSSLGLLILASTCKSPLVCFVDRHGILTAPMSSITGRNIYFCAKRYCSSPEDLMAASRDYNSFLQLVYTHTNLEDNDRATRIPELILFVTVALH
jgi:hypothetical protein